MIDPKNIFPRIKQYIDECCPGLSVIATGSRVRGTSTKKKWDFDVMLVGNVDREKAHEVHTYVNRKFDGELDENGNQIKVDILLSVFGYPEDALNKMKHGRLL